MKRYIKCSYHEVDLQAAIDDLNAKLPSLRTWDDLQSFKEEMDSYGYGLIFYMKTKRGGRENGMWKLDDTTVEYITDQTTIEYKCQIKNLHRFMYVGY